MKAAGAAAVVPLIWLLGSNWSVTWLMKSADGTSQRRTQSDGADTGRACSSEVCAHAEREGRGRGFNMSRCHISASNIDRVLAERPSEPRLTPDGDLGEPRHVSCEPPHVPP